MAVPRQRKTKSATRQRRSHDALKRLVFARCKNCGQAVMPHVVCQNCGYYRGRLVKQIEVTASKK